MLKGEGSVGLEFTDAVPAAQIHPGGHASALKVVGDIGCRPPTLGKPRGVGGRQDDMCEEPVWVAVAATLV